MYLQEVVYDAVEEPLDIHLPFASEGKSIESEGRADVGEDRFRGRESFIIDEATFYGIYLPFHLLGEGFGEVGGMPLKEVDLTTFRSIGVAHTVLTQGTGPTVGLASVKLDRAIPLHHHIARHFGRGVCRQGRYSISYHRSS